jgi:hypothetical protein
MTTITLTAPRRVALGDRLLGALGMLGAPLMLIEGIRFGFRESRMDFWTSLGGAVYMLGALASLVALRRRRVSGDGRFAAGLHGFQIATTLLAACWSAAHIVTGPDTRHGLLWIVGDSGWPLTHVSMLAYAVLVLGAGRLRGWRRWPALACGLALPSFFVLGPLVGSKPLGAASFGVLTTLGFFALGRIVFTTAAPRR